MKEKDERKSNESLQHRLKVERMIQQAAVNRQSLLLVLLIRVLTSCEPVWKLSTLDGDPQNVSPQAAGSISMVGAARPNLKGRHEVRGSPPYERQKGRVPHAVASTYKLYNASQIRAIS